MWFNSCPSGGDDVPEGEEVPDPGLPEYNPEPVNPGEPEDPTKHWFCGLTESDWDTDLWNEYDVGDFLVKR